MIKTMSRIDSRSAIIVLLGLGGLVLALFATRTVLRAQRHEQIKRVQAIVRAEAAKLRETITVGYSNVGAESTGIDEWEVQWHYTPGDGSSTPLLELDIKWVNGKVLITTGGGTLDDAWAQAFDKALTAEGIPTFTKGVGRPAPVDPESEPGSEPVSETEP
jgi:hypothetical protein